MPHDAGPTGNYQKSWTLVERSPAYNNTFSVVEQYKLLRRLYGRIELRSPTFSGRQCLPLFSPSTSAIRAVHHVESAAWTAGK